MFINLSSIVQHWSKIQSLPWGIQRKAHVPGTRTSNTRSLDASRRAHGPRGADTLLPSALGDVDRSVLLDSAQHKLRRPRGARRGRRGAAALRDGPGYAAADAELRYVLVVEDDFPG